jgi:hypothetical protein
VVLAIGAHISRSLRIPGEDLEGVWGGTEFLQDVALGKAPDLRASAWRGGRRQHRHRRRPHRLRLGAARCTWSTAAPARRCPPKSWRSARPRRKGSNCTFLVNPTRILGDGKVDRLELIQPRAWASSTRARGGVRSPSKARSSSCRWMWSSRHRPEQRCGLRGEWRRGVQPQHHRQGERQTEHHAAWCLCRRRCRPRPGHGHRGGGPREQGGPGGGCLPPRGRAPLQRRMAGLRHGAPDLQPEDYAEATRAEMPVQEPAVRRNNWREVELGFAEAACQEECKRCLRCDLEEKVRQNAWLPRRPERSQDFSGLGLGLNIPAQRGPWSWISMSGLCSVKM